MPIIIENCKNCDKIPRVTIEDCELTIECECYGVAGYNAKDVIKRWNESEAIG